MSVNLVGQNRRQLEAALSRLVNGLIAKDFTFVTTGGSQRRFQEKLVRYADARAGLPHDLIGIALDLGGMPEVVKIVAKHVVSFGTDMVDDKELAALHELMRSSFQYCAVSFSKVYGPRFVVLINGDAISPPQFRKAALYFEKINQCMMSLGGRLNLKLLGKPVAGINAHAATGSMIILVSSAGRAQQLSQQLVRTRPFGSDKRWGQLKTRVASPISWAKAAFSVLDYRPTQLRQEAIILDVTTGRATSTVPLRLGMEFGFSLKDINGPLNGR